MEKILAAFFPDGYGKDRDDSGEKYMDTWYLGWCKAGGSDFCPLEINLDLLGTMLIFALYPEPGSDFNTDMAKGYIAGVVSQVCPDMDMDAIAERSVRFVYNE